MTSGLEHKLYTTSRTQLQTRGDQIPYVLFPHHLCQTGRKQFHIAPTGLITDGQSLFPTSSKVAEKRFSYTICLNLRGRGGGGWGRHAAVLSHRPHIARTPHQYGKTRWWPPGYSSFCIRKAKSKIMPLCCAHSPKLLASIQSTPGVRRPMHQFEEQQRTRAHARLLAICIKARQMFGDLRPQFVGLRESQYSNTSA